MQLAIGVGEPSEMQWSSGFKIGEMNDFLLCVPVSEPTMRVLEREYAAEMPKRKLIIRVQIKLQGANVFVTLSKKNKFRAYEVENDTPFHVYFRQQGVSTPWSEVRQSKKKLVVLDEPCGPQALEVKINVRASINCLGYDPRIRY